MKPSRGRIPTGPEFGELWEGFATDHALTLSVRDSAALLDATSAPEVGAPYGIPKPVRPFLDEISTEPKRLKVAWTTRGAADRIDADCVAAVEHAARLCEDLGHEVEETHPGLDYEPLIDAIDLIVDGHTAAMLDQFEPLFGKKITEEMVEPWTWAKAQIGWKASAADFANSKVAVNQATRSLGRFLQRYDVLLTPTLGTIPPKLGVHDTTLPYERVRQTLYDFIPFTWLHNMTGTPAMSVPLFWNSEGLPVGVQFAAAYAREDKLFQLAGQLERARPWRGRIPSL